MATGDHDPRIRIALLSPEQKREVDFNGFVTINDSYTGKRVTSTVFLNGFGGFPRVLDFGIEGLSSTISILNSTGFTNLIYTGFSGEYLYNNHVQRWRLAPNVLFYWQEEPSLRFESKKTAKNSSLFAQIPHSVDSFLGTELNLLMDIELVKDVRFFAVGAVFVPGDHFKRMKGVALNSAQSSFIKDKTLPRESLISDDLAYLFNIGFKYTF